MSRKRIDGTDIDPVKNLADFVQSFPASGPVGEPETPAPTPVAAPAEVPDEYAGKTPAEIIAEAKAAREDAKRYETAAANARAELTQQRTRAEVEATARRVMAEQQQQAARPQSPAPTDPRLAKIDESWFTDPAEARRLLREIDDERIQKQIDSRVASMKEEISNQTAAEKQRAQGNYAFEESMRRLRAAGVPESDLSNRFKITGLYTAVTLKPTAEAPNPYYTAGGPLNPDVLERAWKDLYGGGAAPQPQAAPATQPILPVIAPPGSSRPAPAAAPPSATRAAPVTADIRRDYEHVAAAAGLDPEKMLARRQARIAREKGN